MTVSISPRWTRAASSSRVSRPRAESAAEAIGSHASTLCGGRVAPGRSLPPDREVLVGHGRQRETQGVAFDLGTDEVVDLLVKERDHQRVAGDQILDLPIDRVADVGIDLGAPPLDELVDLWAPEEPAEDPLVGLEGPVDKSVGIGIVGDPQHDGEIPVRVLLVRDELGHCLVDRANRESHLFEGLRELLVESGELAEEHRMDRCGDIALLPRDRVADGFLRSEWARAADPPPRARRMSQKSRRNQTVCGNGQPSERAADDPGGIDRVRQTAAQRRVREESPMDVECDEVDREPRRLPISRTVARMAAEGLDVGREEIRGDREPAFQELASDLLGRHSESKDDAVAPGVALAPVVGILLELETPPRLEGHDAERTGSDTVVAPGSPDSRGSLRNDGGRRLRHQSRKERNRFHEVDVELRRRDDVKAFEGRLLVIEELSRTEDG